MAPKTNAETLLSEEELIRMTVDATFNKPLSARASTIELQIREEVAEIKRLGGSIDIPANIA